jgi:hypothetical protein
MSTVDELIANTEALLRRFDGIESSWQYSQTMGGWFKDKEGYEALMTELISLMHHIYGDDHPHYQRIIYFHNQHSLEGLLSSKGVLIGPIEVLKKGYLENLSKRLAVEISTDFLSAARDLAEAGEKDPAAVLACSVLEDALKRLASRNGFSELANQELSVVANSLLARKVITKTTHASVIGFKTLRNAALHAQWNEVSLEAVRLLIAFLPTFLEQHGGA